MLSDEQGAQAIIALQAMAGITEPQETAEANWANFSETDKLQTESAHKIFCGGFPDTEEDSSLTVGSPGDDL